MNRNLFLLSSLFALFYPVDPVLYGATSPKVLYRSLDPTHIVQHICLYRLYPDSDEGKRALMDAWRLLQGGGDGNGADHSLDLLPSLSEAFSKVAEWFSEPFTAQGKGQEPLFSPSQIEQIRAFGHHLSNRELKGWHATTEEEILSLPPDQIDLARGLFLSQAQDNAALLEQMACYETLLDFMALQLFVRLPQGASPRDKINALNHYIFFELGYRFPPQSLYAKDIDLYTFLPSVLDSRRGVCLGVSLMYLCLAQRLGLQLEMVTPPGHIFLRYSDGQEVINIETTARGIHLDDEEYLSVETRALQRRNLKEVIGLAHFNLASVWWRRDRHRQALHAYHQAAKYLVDDKLLKELMAFNYLFIGEEAKGKALLEEVKEWLPEHAVSRSTIAEDLMNGYCDVSGIKLLFDDDTDSRQELLKKKERLEAEVQKYPRFRAAIFHLAQLWLQLHREREALQQLEKYHALEKGDVQAEYVLAQLYTGRYDYRKAWEHLLNAERLAKGRNHNPKQLRDLRIQLAQRKG